MGDGVPVDYAAALHWYSLAADHGDAIGMEGVGELYSCGQGVPLDPITARQWMQKAADAGNVEARDWLTSNPQGACKPCPPPKL